MKKEEKPNCSSSKNKRAEAPECENQGATDDPGEVIDKLSHLLGQISKEVELSTGQVLIIQPAKTKEIKKLYLLMNDISEYFAKKHAGQGRAAGVKTNELLETLKSDLMLAEADLINLHDDGSSAEDPEIMGAIGKAEARAAILKAQIKEIEDRASSSISQDLESLLTTDAAPFYMEYEDRIIQTVIDLSGFSGSADDIMELPFADTLMIFVGVIGVNLDFFVKRLKPLMTALGEIKSTLGRKRQKQAHTLSQALKKAGFTL